MKLIIVIFSNEMNLEELTLVKKPKIKPNLYIFVKTYHYVLDYFHFKIYFVLIIQIKPIFLIRNKLFQFKPARKKI